MRIAIIGAGATGLAAAFDLARAGHTAVVYEASGRLGGLAAGFREPHWQWSVERFYHHWFHSDKDILRLAEELGVRDKVIYKTPITALYHAGRFYPFDSPLAVLTFPGIPMADRVRFGAVGAYLKLTRDWQRLEHYTAHDWLGRRVGPRAYQALWEPMLEGKFGRHYQDVNMAWFWARIHARTRKLGTFEGGFQAFMDVLGAAIQHHRGTLHLDCHVQRLQPEAGRWCVVTARGEETFDLVLSTTSPALFSAMVPDLSPAYLDRLSTLRSLGAIALVVALDRPLGDGVYWYNLPKRAGFPCLCLVEHTSFISPDKFGGDHIVYLGDYLPSDHTYMTMSQDQMLREYMPALTLINKAFSPQWIRKSWLFRAGYAQPVPTRDHSRNIPDTATPLRGLYWASMSHVYPWDRGTNYAVQLGRRVAARMLAEAR
ncbi:NAD(P)/FAD-dependent oxidoreductase [bacterium]|nr:NAD(P)/FAD-dependent oxidoreductase [bacterium]